MRGFLIGASARRAERGCQRSSAGRPRAGAFERSARLDEYWLTGHRRRGNPVDCARITRSEQKRPFHKRAKRKSQAAAVHPRAGVQPRAGLSSTSVAIAVQARHRHDERRDRSLGRASVTSDRQRAKRKMKERAVRAFAPRRPDLGLRLWHGLRFTRFDFTAPGRCASRQRRRGTRHVVPEVAGRSSGRGDLCREVQKVTHATSTPRI